MPWVLSVCMEKERGVDWPLMADFHISAERRIPGLFFQVPPRCTKCHKMPVKYQCAKLAYCCWSALRAVHTGDKVDCCRNGRQIGNKVDCRCIRSTLLAVLTTNRQQLEFDSLSRSTLLPTRSTLLPECRTCFRLCCQCVRAKATRSTFNKVDRVEFNFVASVCWG